MERTPQWTLPETLSVVFVPRLVVCRRSHQELDSCVGDELFLTSMVFVTSEVTA